MSTTAKNPEAGKGRTAELTLRFDREALRIEVTDAFGREMAGARAVTRDEPDGDWWSTIHGEHGSGRDVRHTGRGSALESMLEAATGLAADPRAISAGVRQVERPKPKAETEH